MVETVSSDESDVEVSGGVLWCLWMRINEFRYRDGGGSRYPRVSPLEVRLLLVSDTRGSRALCHR